MKHPARCALSLVTQITAPIRRLFSGLTSGLAQILVPGLIATFLSTACGGTDVGNPAIDVEFTTYNSTVATTTIDRAWLVIEYVRLRPAANCEGDAELDLVGPFVVDLMSGEPLPELRDLAVTPGGYCRIEMKWDGLEGQVPAGAPAEIAGASILVHGTRGDGTEFIIRSERDDELKLRSVGASFTVDDATGALFVAFDGAVWLRNIDLDGAEVGTDGIIHIDDQNNGQLGDIFDDNVADAVKLFDDDDDDGDLDDDERDANDALAETESSI